VFPQGPAALPCAATDHAVETCLPGDGSCPLTPVDCVGDWDACRPDASGEACSRMFFVATADENGGGSCEAQDQYIEPCACPVVVVAVVNTDCYGLWSPCGRDCTSEYSVFTGTQGAGAACPERNGAERACEPGAGMCPDLAGVSAQSNADVADSSQWTAPAATALFMLMVIAAGAAIARAHFKAERAGSPRTSVGPPDGLKGRDPECADELDPASRCFYDNPARASAMSMGRSSAVSERGSTGLHDKLSAGRDLE
jgi:hypothetical protein